MSEGTEKVGQVKDDGKTEEQKANERKIKASMYVQLQASPQPKAPEVPAKAICTSCRQVGPAAHKDGCSRPRGLIQITPEIQAAIDAEIQHGKTDNKQAPADAGEHR